MRKAAFWIAFGANLLSVGVHAYLLNLHYNLKFGQSQATSFCNVNDVFNCEAVAASRFSEVLGVPVAMWGLLINLLMLGFAVRAFWSEDTNRPRAHRELLIIAGGIAAASLVMGGISIFALSTYCIVCIAAYVLSFISLGGYAACLRPNSSLPLGLDISLGSTIKTLGISGFIVLCAGFILNQQAQAAMGGQDMANIVQTQIREWKANPHVEIKPGKGLFAGAAPEQAKMTIIEFADFLCSHCKEAGPVLHAFLLSHASDTRLIFQFWPLDGECNSSVQQSDGIRCGLARAVYCAEKSAKGWQAHGWIYGHQEEFYNKANVPSLLDKMSVELALNKDELNQCIASPEAKEEVERQAALGTSLKLGGTPTIFVNGQQLQGAQVLPILQEAYKEVISSHP